MKSLLISGLMLSSMAYAEPLKITVQNFNFSYQNPLGEGSATSFTRNRLLNNEVQVKVEKVENNFHLEVSGAENEEFELKDAPSFMTEAETMSVNAFNLTLADNLNLNLGSGNFYSKDDSLELSALSLNCNRDQSLTEEMDQIISGCVKSMNLDMGKFSSASVEKTIMHTLESSMGFVFEKATLGVSSLDLTSQNGSYKLAADVKAQVSGKVKSKGNLNYDPASGVLSVKISEVKFGFLNITSKVFDELKKKESEKLQVKKPYVYYKLK
ncbi:MAG: hypothetical protein ACLGHN_15465 [Bacteriovoracia bacterium]